jgi:hypothetical protein
VVPELAGDRPPAFDIERIAELIGDGTLEADVRLR